MVGRSSSRSAIRIEPVGSCATLVAEKLLASCTNFQLTEELAHLLTGKRIENEEKKKIRLVLLIH